MSVNRIIVLGSGGHGRVVADTLLKMQAAGEPVEPIGFLDDDVSRKGELILGLPVLGAINREDLASIEHEGVIIGIGSNWLRFILAHKLKQWGETSFSAIHPSAIIGNGTEIGTGTLVGPGVVINTGARIGEHVILNTSSSVDHDCIVSDFSHLCPGVHLGGDVRIGEGVMCGIGSSLLPQSRLGPWTVLGAGSVVIRPIRGFEVRVGAPSRRTNNLVHDLTADTATWRDLLSRHPHDVYHLPAYLETCAREEQARSMALHVEIEDTEIFLPLLVKQVPRTLGLRDYWDAATPYGFPSPLIKAETPERLRVLFDALTLACQEQRIVTLFIRLHPCFMDHLAALKEHGQMVMHGPTVLIHLEETPEQHWAQTRTRHRRSLQKLDKAGFTVRIDDWSQFDAFKDVYRATMERIGATQYYFFSTGYFCDLKQSLGDALHLVSVHAPDGTVAAAGLFTHVGEIVQYHLGGTAEGFLQQAPSKLMIHGARAWFREHGARILNLGGGLGGAQDDLFQFKRGFSEHTADFWTFRLVTDAAACEELDRRHADLHRELEMPCGYFPRYRYHCS
ncbi:MAG: NeuD/PglB/VioB family sugar acetyltransferase [Calditrichaeota bacterium]|nr:NeuD/PglB/VioB family sugar acetyltransferase [Candidatus Cloacimonadota bacterium]MCB1047807.1 NeuD/PglB/VioB family sugar acetyltransferase [Calditrichota bacterium]